MPEAVTGDSNLKEIGDRLLLKQTAQIEAGSRLKFKAGSRPRWEPHGSKVIIMRRGSKKPGVNNYVATISNAKDNPLRHLYPEWEPVLMEYKRRRAENGGKRQKLEGLKRL